MSVWERWPWKGRFPLSLGLGLSFFGCGPEEVVLGTFRGGAGGQDAAGGASSAEGGADGGWGGACAEAARLVRFDFTGNGAVLVDEASGKTATVIGGAVPDGAGRLVLDGVDDYVEFDGSPFPLTSFSIAVWVEYEGVAAYQRLFDFGSQGGDPGNLVGTSYLALTPTTGYVPSGLSVLLSESGSAGEVVVPSSASIAGREAFVVVVVEEASVSLYLDGSLVAREPHGVSLESFAPEHLWLGRSQYAQDPYAIVTYLDFALYSGVLEPCAVAALFDAGPG